MRIIIFVSIVFSIFTLIGYYVFTRLGQTFPSFILGNKISVTIYTLLLASFFIGKVIENMSINIISEAFIRVGSIAAGYLVYGLLIIVFFDLLRAINHFIPFFPKMVIENYSISKTIIGISSLLLISGILLMGFMNTIRPKIKNLELSINKPKSSIEELNIIAVSDIHLGTMVSHSKAKRLAKTIIELQPDLVLIGGDIIDDNIKVVKKEDLLKYFKDIKPKYGMYSCMGNHEYISRAHTNLAYIESNGIKMLRDTVVNINDLFYIIGRDDKEGGNFGGGKRKSLEELSENVDFELPVFLLDHQPFKLNETAEFPIDFQFSGHTHNGQFWPFNYITGLIFEQDWGYLKKKNTHFYVSSGYGTSVVPIRVGNDSEIIQIKITNSETTSN